MRNLLERTVLLGRGEQVTRGMLGLDEGQDAGAPDPGMQSLMDALAGRIPSEGFPLEETLNMIEKEIICQVNERVQGNQTRAAKILHMNRDKLRYRMKQYEIERESHASS
jgi:DNA-binding NtrC family response regulator